MKRTSQFLIDAFITLLIIAPLFIHIKKRCNPVISSSIRIDSIYITKPVPKDSQIVRYLEIKLPNIVICADSVHQTPKNEKKSQKTDSNAVIIPISQHEYSDSLYHAWVSGYQAKLDSIHIYSKNMTTTINHYPKPKRWGIGFQAGATYKHNRVEPYIGVGIHYNIFSW